MSGKAGVDYGTLAEVLRELYRHWPREWVREASDASWHECCDMIPRVGVDNAMGFYKHLLGQYLMRRRAAHDQVLAADNPEGV